MKRWSVAIAAAAVCLMASSQARADYQVIRWTSGFCQVWDHGLPTMPFPGDFKPVSKRFKTFGEALNERGRLVVAGRCW